jgi:hypothetical protein
MLLHSSMTGQLLTPYVPKNFGKEYFKVKGSAQWAMFSSVALGAKPSYDDWIPVSKYSEFALACKAYGLALEPDIIFRQERSPKHDIAGGKNITTTFFTVSPFLESATEGEVHVFIGRTNEDAKKAKRYGWYPLIVNKRYINKPFIDNVRFGSALGYPDCCTDFFRRYNNWFTYSNPYEAYKNTPKAAGKAVASYYCNNFLMDKTFFYIHHIPCSYRCESTIELAKKVEERLLEVEPDFVKKAREMLSRPLLVFAEQNFIVFDGKVKRHGGKEIISYSNAQYVTNPSRPEDTLDIASFLAQGNFIIVDKESIHIKKNNETIRQFNKNERWFVLDFD